MALPWAPNRSPGDSVDSKKSQNPSRAGSGRRNLRDMNVSDWTRPVCQVSGRRPGPPTTSRSPTARPVVSEKNLSPWLWQWQSPSHWHRLAVTVPVNVSDALREKLELKCQVTWTHCKKNLNLNVTWMSNSLGTWRPQHFKFAATISQYYGNLVSRAKTAAHSGWQRKENTSFQFGH